MKAVEKVKALKVLDSRGDWTVEAIVTLEGSAAGYSSVPTGKSVGSFEVKNLPAEASASIIENVIGKKMIGKEFANQEEFDRFLLSFDDSLDKGKLGGNTILALSIAFCKATAVSLNMALYEYLDSVFYPTVKNFSLPVPIFNLINGGRHASGGLDFQEFLLIPAKSSIEENVVVGQQVYQALESILLSHNFATGVGDEGGFTPKGLSAFGVLNFMVEASKLCGYQPGQDFFLGLDCAASQLVMGDVYRLKNESLDYSAPAMREYYLKLTKEFPIVYIEDPLSETSFDDWKILKKEMGGKVDIIGDDLIATNSARVDMAVTADAVSGVIIKPNQVGTITETLETVKNCRRNKLSIVASHRSGDTPDVFIADFAVGIGAKYLKAGAPARGERVAKYDRLLEIKKEITSSA